MSIQPWPATDPEAPLTGLKVVDLSSQLPGPYATALLADLGAAVIKVEPPGGDVARRVDPAMYSRLNDRKSILELDLKSDGGRARLHRLVAEAAVVIESWRPGVSRRLAADPETLEGVRPGLLYCSITGYGQDGPLARTGAHDLNIQAAAGAVHPDQVVDRVGVAWADLAAGQAAALAVTAHWHAGRSGFIDLAMLDVARAWTQIKPDAVSAGEPTYGVVTTGDGARFAIAILEDEVWQRLCLALGWDAWRTDPSLADPDGRRAASAQIRGRLDAAVAALDATALQTLAEAADLPITAISPRDPKVAQQLSERERSGAFSYQLRPVPRAATLHGQTERGHQ